jgi:hypothetical protein
MSDQEYRAETLSPDEQALLELYRRRKSEAISVLLDPAAHMLYVTDIVTGISLEEVKLEFMEDSKDTEINWDSEIEYLRARIAANDGVSLSTVTPEWAEKKNLEDTKKIEKLRRMQNSSLPPKPV